MRSTFHVSGRVRITEIPAQIAMGRTDPFDSKELDFMYRHGRAKVVRETDNMIVDLGISAISRMIGGARGAPMVDDVGITTTADLAVNTMKLGDGIAPTAPAAGDTGLWDPTPIYSITSLVCIYDDAYSVTFRGLLPVNAAVGAQITEEALFLQIDKLFARTTFAAVPKFNTHALQFDHKITVAR